MAAKNPLNELPDGIVKHKLPDFFKSYPLLNEPRPSSWFAWSLDEKKVIAHNAAVCHADMSTDGIGYDELITAVPHSDELSLEYLRMLIRGPFRSVSDLIRLERLGNNYFLRCLNLDRWPANVLMNFCIASRVPIEFRFMLEPWAKRCEIGYDPVLSFLMTYSYGSTYEYDGNTPVYTVGADRTFTIYRGGHMWLDPASSWSNILKGEMVGLSKSFKIAPEDSRPTNCIWGVCKDYTSLMKMTDAEIAAFYTIPVEKFEAPPTPPPSNIKKKGAGFNPYQLPPLGMPIFNPQPHLQAQAIAEFFNPNNQPVQAPPQWVVNPNLEIVQQQGIHDEVEPGEEQPENPFDDEPDFD